MRLKEAYAQQIYEDISKYQNFILINFSGLSAPLFTDIRKQLRIKGIKIKVLKNFAIKTVLKKLGAGEISEKVSGMNAIVYGEDPVIVSKEILSIVSQNNLPKINFGYIYGRYFGPKDIEYISTLAPRQEALAKIAGAINSVLIDLTFKINLLIYNSLCLISAFLKSREQKN